MHVYTDIVIKFRSMRYLHKKVSSTKNKSSTKMKLSKNKSPKNYLQTKKSFKACIIIECINLKITVDN